MYMRVLRIRFYLYKSSSCFLMYLYVWLINLDILRMININPFNFDIKNGYWFLLDYIVRQCGLRGYIKNRHSDYMQVLQSSYKIDEDATKDALLSVVSDKYCRSILEAIMDKPKSAMGIAVETKTPISTVYRRIQTLHDNKLLHTSGLISEDGKKLFLYKSKIRGIQSTFNDGKIEVELIPNN